MRKSIKCCVDLRIQSISCPGVRLDKSEILYLEVSMFGCTTRTRLLQPIFPIIVREKFRFEKVFTYCSDPGEVADVLESEHVEFELRQMCPLSRPILLANHLIDARSFLFPYPSERPSYASYEREVIMEKTIYFPEGISPMVTFSTKTLMKEVTSPRKELYCEPQRPPPGTVTIRPKTVTCHVGDTSPRCVDAARRRRHYRSASLNASVRKKLRNLGIHLDSAYDRPPFVVPTKHQSLIDRKPGGPPAFSPYLQLTRPRSRSRRRRCSSVTRSTDDLCFRRERPVSCSHCSWQVTREPSDDEDEQLAARMNRVRVRSPMTVASRSPSPALSRRCLRDSLTDELERRTRHICCAVNRTKRLERSCSPPCRRNSLDDIEYELIEARNRRYHHP